MTAKLAAMLLAYLVLALCACDLILLFKLARIGVSRIERWRLLSWLGFQGYTIFHELHRKVYDEWRWDSLFLLVGTAAAFVTLLMRYRANDPEEAGP